MKPRTLGPLYRQVQRSATRSALAHLEHAARCLEMGELRDAASYLTSAALAIPTIVRARFLAWRHR